MRNGFRSFWWPEQDRDTSCPRDLKPRQIVVIDRRPYRVIEVRNRELVDWDQEDQDTWNRAGRPDPADWPRRPMTVTARHEPEVAADDEHFTLAATDEMFVLPEHYSVCRSCGELPPCRHNELEEAIAREQRQIAKMLAILPGCCHACNQPVTRRQRAITFPGPNLARPDLGDDSAVFHLRQDCRAVASEYDRRWAAAVPGRARMLYCTGRITVHYDGTLECTEGLACPGDVQHAGEERHHPEVGSPVSAGCWCIAEHAATQAAQPAEGAA